MADKPDEATKRIVEALRDLEEHGHELPDDVLQPLSPEHQEALEAAKPQALAKALEVLKEKEKAPGKDP